MLVGILVISSLFLIPLEEHWWCFENNSLRGYQQQTSTKSQAPKNTYL